MSHQTGIRGDDKLRSFFGKCRSGNVRVVKVSIENEKLTLDEYKEAQGTWEEDYDELVLPLLEDKQPCYFLYRLDSKNEAGYEWLFISWSPDSSPVRQKMLYASTKATLKMEFGQSQIKDDLFGTSQDDVSLHGYYKHTQVSLAPAPMTFAEEELQMIKKSEICADVGIDTKHQTIQSIAFPISDEAIAKLFDFRDGAIDYVQMSIHLEREEIQLENSTATNVPALRRCIPSDHARFHIFNFKHSYEGDRIESVVFIYSVPGYNCSVKERMLYSSCKGNLLEIIETKIGITIARKIEIDDGHELTEDFLLEEVHPKTNIHRQKFAKPKGPPNRGARRIIKPKSDSPADDGILV